MSTYRNERSIVNVIKWKEKKTLEIMCTLLAVKMTRINHFTVGAFNFNKIIASELKLIKLITKQKIKFLEVIM
jgi:3D (Asp-Asp-Asp) domain-containing protein